MKIQSWRLVFFAAALGAGCQGKIGDVSSGAGGSNPTTGTAGTQVSTGTGGAGNAVSTGTGGATVVITGTGGTSGGGVTFCNTRGIAPTSQVARLTNAQYDRVINDLLGVQTLKASNNVQPSTILATDQAGGLTDLGWSSYQSVADMIATQVMADATLKKNFLKCTPTGDGKACLHDTIIQFGRRAFRRPLDRRRGRPLRQARRPTARRSPPTGTADEIASTLLYGFLVSPSFLQRGEMAETLGRRGELRALEPRGRLAPLVHAVGLDARRRPGHGRRREPAGDARPDPDPGAADGDGAKGPR